MKRGRPRKTDPDVALDSAMKVFWRQGFEGTSMNDLVAATGMAKPGLYATFGDKEAVYTKALERYSREVSMPLLDDLRISADPVDVVVRRFLMAVAASAADKSSPGGCFAINSVVNSTSQPSSLEALARTITDIRRAAFVERFVLAKQQGELPVDADATALGEFFAGQIIALAMMGQGGASLDVLEQMINVAMTVLPASQRS